MIGAHAGFSNDDGSANTFIGLGSGYNNISGNENTFLGLLAGANNETGSNNVFIGNQAGFTEMGSNKLYIANSAIEKPLIYGEFDNNLTRINGTLETISEVNSEDNTKNIIALSRNNTGNGASDVGFSLENIEADFKWAFRTYYPEEGFTATKIGTGGTEFEVGNLGTNFGTTVVKMGGVTVFENGHLVTASSRSLKTDIQPLDTQPVSYAYKAHKDEAVVGFIAEDVPELVAMPSGKSIDSTEIVAVLTKVVQEQDKILTETRAKIQAKDARIDTMETEQKVIKEKLNNMEDLLNTLASKNIK